MCSQTITSDICAIKRQLELGGSETPTEGQLSDARGLKNNDGRGTPLGTPMKLRVCALPPADSRLMRAFGCHSDGLCAGLEYVYTALECPLQVR